MKVSDDLTALVFELQRVRSPAEKARVLARAWRTVRGLSGSERRLLAREVGFEGAENLVEGLAGKSGDAFSPAAVLEALGKMKREKGLSVGGLLAGLMDPDRRDDLLLQGMDLAADSFDRREEDREASLADPVVYDIPTAQPITELVRPKSELEAARETPAESEAEEVVPPEPEIPLPPRVAESPPIEGEMTDDPDPSPDSEPEPESAAPTSVREPSVWDEPWQRSAAVSPSVSSAESPVGSTGGAFITEPGSTTGSVLDRLRGVRSAIPGLRGAGLHEIREHLESLPETWARRRAVAAMIEAGVPVDAGEVLDLIEDFDRPSDRRWCLAVLAARGDLHGEALERALDALASPVARRRVEALADRAH